MCDSERLATVIYSTAEGKAMNHKWENDKCLKCGINRCKQTRKLHMAIVNHPPWDVYKYDHIYFYFNDSGKGTYNRPECK